MEHNDPSQRQYAPNPYAEQQASQIQPAGGQLPTQYGQSSPNGRFRQQQAFVQQSPTAPQSSARGASGTQQQIYAYPHTAQYGGVQTLPSSAMPYAPTLAAQGGQRQMSQHSYQSYGGQTMYGMAPPQSQQHPMFDPVAQYRQRPSSGSESIEPQFGVPQGAQYFLAAQGGPTSAPAPELAVQQMPSQYQQAGYPQPPPSMPQPYPAQMMDTVQQSSYATYAQQPQQVQYGHGHQGSRQIDRAYSDYKATLRSIFSSAREGILRDIHHRLLQVSQYLLGHVEALGLTRDEEGTHDERIRLWDEFNRAWLVTLQRQYDMTEELLRSGQPFREPRSIMCEQTLEQLSRELIRLCDGVERFGLVDYQMGVAEDEILALAQRCLSLLEALGRRASTTAVGESSSAQAGRGR